MDNLKLLEPSNLDEYQMNNRTFDSTKDAWRVSFVDGLTLNVDNINIPENTFQTKQQVIHTVEIKEVRVPEIIRETIVKTIDVPQIIKEIEYRTIEVPVMVPQIQIVEVEKPIIVKEIQVIEKEVMVVPLIIKVCAIAQSLALIGLLVANLILKG
jgi:hypothetical protein